MKKKEKEKDGTGQLECEEDSCGYNEAQGLLFLSLFSLFLVGTNKKKKNNEKTKKYKKKKMMSPAG